MGFTLTKKCGHQFGFALELVGGCCLLVSFYAALSFRLWGRRDRIVSARRPAALALHTRLLVWVLVPVGASLVGVGLWLKRRLYLMDPQAREAYRNEMISLSFPACVRKFRSVHVIADVLGVEGARRQLNELFADVDGLAGASLLDLLSRLGGGPSVVLQCRNENLITSTDLQLMFFRCVKVQSCSNHATPFTDLWAKFSEASGGKGLDEVIRVLEIRSFELPLRDLLEQEFLSTAGPAEGWPGKVVEPSGATAPPSTTSCSNSLPASAYASSAVDVDYTVFDRIEHAAPFCVQSRIVTRDFFATAIRECRMSKTLPYSKLLERGLFRLFQSGLIDGAWCQRQLEEEWRRYGTSLRALTSTVSLEDQLASGMIPQAVAFRQPFTAALPTSPFVDVRTSPFAGLSRWTPESSIIDFLQQHQAVLQRYGEQLLDPHWWPAVLQARHEWDVAQETARSRFRSATNEPVRTKDMTAEAFAAEKKKYLADQAELERQKRAFLEQEKQRIHSNFCCTRATGVSAQIHSAVAQAASVSYTTVANLTSNNQCSVM